MLFSLCVLSCAQVHGIAHDTIAFVQSVLNTELNSATDNPMVFPSVEGEEWGEKEEKEEEEKEEEEHARESPTCLSMCKRVSPEQLHVRVSMWRCMLAPLSLCLRASHVCLSLDQSGLVMPSQDFQEEAPHVGVMQALSTKGVRKADMDGNDAAFELGHTKVKGPSDLYFGAPGGFVISGGNFHGTPWRLSHRHVAHERAGLVPGGGDRRVFEITWNTTVVGLLQGSTPRR